MQPGNVNFSVCMLLGCWVFLWFVFFFMSSQGDNYAGIDQGLQRGAVPRGEGGLGGPWGQKWVGGAGLKLISRGGGVGQNLAKAKNSFVKKEKSFTGERFWKRCNTPYPHSHPPPLIRPWHVKLPRNTFFFKQ